MNTIFPYFTPSLTTIQYRSYTTLSHLSRGIEPGTLILSLWVLFFIHVGAQNMVIYGYGSLVQTELNRLPRGGIELTASLTRRFPGVLVTVLPQ